MGRGILRFRVRLRIGRFFMEHLYFQRNMQRDEGLSANLRRYKAMTSRRRILSTMLLTIRYVGSGPVNGLTVPFINSTGSVETFSSFQVFQRGPFVSNLGCLVSHFGVNVQVRRSVSRNPRVVSKRITSNHSNVVEWGVRHTVGAFSLDHPRTGIRSYAVSSTSRGVVASVGL